MGIHYSDVIMDVIASHITSLTIVYSTVYTGADQRKTSKLRVTGLCAGNSPVTGEFPAQMASNTENVSIWWHHNVIICSCTNTGWPKYFSRRWRCVCYEERQRSTLGHSGHWTWHWYPKHWSTEWLRILLCRHLCWHSMERTLTACLRLSEKYVWPKI